ncbi:hypothetical protein M885DRAFT_535499 [Pelagophyceae sp. CCMP2097]|nr:hypothetical protein M885DRAFT_535499 [Pelagophyceae sp. CCMP2097]
MRRINAQRSQQLPQEIIAQYLLEHFEGQLKEAQAHVFNEFKHDEEDVEEAVAYYDGEGDEEVIEAVNQLRQLYMNIGGSIELDLPEDLTLDKMCTVFEEYMAAVVAAQHAFTAHLHTVKARGGQITSQELNATRQNKIAQHVSVVLQKHGLNNLIFQAAIEKYNDHPQFQAKIASVKAQSDSNGR